MSDIKEYKGKTKLISSSQILPCNYNFKDAQLVMREMVEAGCLNLFRQGYVTQLIHLYIGYGDVRDEGTKGTTRMNVTTNLYSIICDYTDKLFDKIVDKNRPIRRIGYDFAELMSLVDMFRLVMLAQHDRKKGWIKKLKNFKKPC